MTHLRSLFLSASLLWIGGTLHAAADLFDKSNLAAWCIVPFDAGKRGPEERAAMLEKMGVKKFVYDYRKENIPQWDDELNALKKHHIELMGWWFPTSLNDEAKQTLELFKRHGVHPQLWVSGHGGLIQVKDEADQQARIAKEVARLQPICEAVAPLGCQVALYNHGMWYGEPENAIAMVEALKAKGIKNIGMVYNLHHGHGHLDRLAKVLPRMLPHLLCFNLNGMDINGEAKGRKILPLGVGTEDVKVLRIVRASGYSGPIGILNHTDEDAEARLLDNLDGLAWLLPQLDDNPPGPKPKYRTWSDKPAAATPNLTAKLLVIGQGVPSLNKEYGEALKGSYYQQDNEPFRTLPLTIECRAKLISKDHFNILIASDAKSSATHWELYTHAKRGTLALYLPGRGGDFDSKVDVCDGQWHDFVANIDEKNVTLWIDGKQVFTKAVQPLQGTPAAGGIAFGSLVDHSLSCAGLIDDVRLTRGVMKPRKGGAPRLRMDNTIGLWDFDNLDALLPSPAPKPAAFKPDHKPLNPADNVHWQEFVNRERIFDFYGKQALQFMKQKPLPELIPQFPGLDGGQQGHWGNQNDQVTWKDKRFAESDHGPVFSGVFKGAGLTIPKAVCVRFGDKSVVFDPETLSFPIGWSGGFVKLNDARHGFMGGATMDGKVDERFPIASFDKGLVYKGFYRYEKDVIFKCAMEGKDYFEVSPVGINADQVEWQKGGPAQWPQWLETKGKLGTQQPFATDTLTLPFENPYGTLFFITAHDFFSDGTAAIATMTGEVWLVKGIDEKLEKIRWKRFATGLNQPLGMKIVKDKLYVLGRDQITCLHDFNGDDEADFYECIRNAMQTSPGGHDFIVGLETDKEDRWYFASGNQGVCRITGRDKLEVLGTGFRNPDGLGLSPDGRFITTSGQEGDWTPASSIFQIELDHNLGAHFGAGGPKNGQPPESVLMYMPRGEDNSASSQTFISGEKWASLKGDGNFVHLSSGGGGAWLVMRQNVKGRWQAAAVKISGNFDSGPQCARFNPNDGHLYVNGMQGWGSYTPKDGCFQRVRFTGGEKPVPVGFEVRDNGVLLRFNQPVTDADAATCFAQCWNYRYGPQYGSPEYSVKYADTPGHDPLEVRSVQKLDGGKTLFLEIPQIVTASQIHLHVSSGHDIFLTAHALAEPFTEFPGYAKIAKTNHAAQIGLEVPKPSKPNPWAKGEGGREIVIEAALGLQYVQKQLTAKAGEKLTIIFKNPDVVPHNWMLAKPGTLQKLGNLANLMITDPQGLAKHYVPDSDDVLAYTDMTNPKGEFTIHSTAPKEKGDYPYLCTFPGHWMVMNGVLKVE
jgi:azurin